ncbi:unnamed protein product [Urochloa humidicola]
MVVVLAAAVASKAVVAAVHVATEVVHLTGQKRRWEKAPPWARAAALLQVRGAVWQRSSSSRSMADSSRRRRMRAGRREFGRERKIHGGGRKKPDNRKSREAPSHPWEMGLERKIWVPPYSRDPSRDPAGADFFTMSPYFLSRGLSSGLAGDALITSGRWVIITKFALHSREKQPQSGCEVYTTEKVAFAKSSCGLALSLVELLAFLRSCSWF